MKKKAKIAQERYPDFMEDQRKFFDELITSEWESYLNPAWDAIRKFEVDRIFERVSPGHILDVGCGCGYHDLLMAEKHGVERVVGIDYSKKSIETANRTYPHRKVSRYVADIFELQPSAFDMVISFQVIEHIADPVAFLEACIQQVQSGGWVVTTTPNSNRLTNRFLSLFGRPQLLADPQHFREYTVSELIQISSMTGLRFEASFGYGMSLMLPKLKWPNLAQKIVLALGYRIASLADCICIIFRAP
jgi:2-polyprenyl-3-methyl-5-hydroxy-6-metoxy-1,4-benzoquinol methylase